jgi:hypothetical protein
MVSLKDFKTSGVFHSEGRQFLLIITAFRSMTKVYGTKYSLLIVSSLPRSAGSFYRGLRPSGTESVHKQATYSQLTLNPLEFQLIFGNDRHSTAHIIPL